MTLLNERKNMGESVIRERRCVAPPQDKEGKYWVRTSAIILADAHKLYAMWRDVESAPQWQERLQQVIKTGPATSHWVLVHDDRTIEWDAEILADEESKRSAWRSTGGDLQSAGEVIFEPAPTGRGTMVTVLQEFEIGRLAKAW